MKNKSGDKKIVPGLVFEDIMEKRNFETGYELDAVVLEDSG